MIKNILFSKWLYLLFFLSIGAVLLAYQYTMPYSIDVGGIRADDELFISGFHRRETGAEDDYRWTEGQASVYVPGIGHGRSWILLLHLSGYRPPEESLPHAQLKLNGQDLADFIADGGMAEYQFPIETSMIGLDGNLLLEIQTEVFRPQGDSRELGLLVTRLTLVPVTRGIVVPAPATLLLVLASILTLFFFLRWMGASDKIAAAASVPLLLSLDLAIVLHRQYATLYSLLILILLVGASIGALGLQIIIRSLLNRWGGSILGRHRLKPLVGILLLALACHLALTPTPGLVGNMGLYLAWTWKLTTHGLHAVYVPNDMVGPIDYLPLIPYVLSTVGWLYKRFFVSTFPFPPEQSTLLLYSLIKLPAVVANMATGALIFAFVQRKASFRPALTAMTAYVFNPAVLFNSAYGGHTDAIHSLFVLLAIVLLLQRRLAGTWLCISLAALSKPQGTLFLPLVLFLTWRQMGPGAALKGVLLALCVVLAVFSPFLYHGTWESLRGFLLSVGHLDMPVDPAHTTVGAHNLWWLLAPLGAVDDTGGPLSLSPLLDRLVTYRTLGLSLLAFFYALALFRLWKKADELSVPMVAAFVGFACFMSLTQMHENYAFSVLPLLALVFLSARRLAIIYVVLSVTSLTNMFLHDGAMLDMLGLLRHQQPIAAVAYLNAIINAGVLVGWTALLIINWKPGQVSPSQPYRQIEAA